MKYILNTLRRSRERNYILLIASDFVIFDEEKAKETFNKILEEKNAIKINVIPPRFIIGVYFLTNFFISSKNI